MARLTRENRLVNERLTLKSIILDMEDLVLANAGVDAFEEVIVGLLFEEPEVVAQSVGTKAETVERAVLVTTVPPRSRQSSTACRVADCVGINGLARSGSTRRKCKLTR